MLRREFRRFNPELPIERAHTPPGTWYTDPLVFDEERHRVFEKSWIVVGRAGQVVHPGDYFTGQITGNPYVVTRGDDGELRAFHNVCRHHAAEVAQECGNCAELVCRYHGWTYRLDGSLKRAPRGYSGGARSAPESGRAGSGGGAATSAERPRHLP